MNRNVSSSDTPYLIRTIEQTKDGGCFVNLTDLIDQEVEVKYVVFLMLLYLFLRAFYK